MKRFGLRTANQQFARLVRAVRHGEDVLLLERGEPFAIVKPVQRAAGILDRLESKGLLVRARRTGTLSPFTPVRMRDGLTRAVLADRDERD
jgi:prevent-host-death family protein